MRRREFIGLLGGALAVWPHVARAQKEAALPRVGLMLPPSRDPGVNEFLDGLRELGWIEGKTVHVEYRDADGDITRLPELATELVAMKVDVLVTVSTPGVQAAARATTTIPIVAVTGDLVGLGFAAGLAHPGGNVTGQTTFIPETLAKRLDLLKRLLPAMTRASVLQTNAYEKTYGAALNFLEGPARALNVTVRSIVVGGFDDVEHALAEISTGPTKGLIIGDDSQFVTRAAEMAAIVERLGIPCAAPPIIAANGALIGYGVGYGAMFHHAATFVDKILRGAKPGDIPIEQPTKFTTVINVKTAEALGLEIPPTLLASADEVVE